MRSMGLPIRTMFHIVIAQDTNVTLRISTTTTKFRFTTTAISGRCSSTTITRWTQPTRTQPCCIKETSADGTTNRVIPFHCLRIIHSQDGTRRQPALSVRSSALRTRQCRTRTFYFMRNGLRLRLPALRTRFPMDRAAATSLTLAQSHMAERSVTMRWLRRKLQRRRRNRAHRLNLAVGSS